MNIARRMQGVKSSIGFELLKKGKALKAQGEDVVSLAIGELRWNTYKPLRDRAKEAIDKGYTKYTPSEGRQSLRKKLSEKASKDFNVNFDTENVFIGSGCKGVLFGIFQSICNPGDEVILPAPYWMSYPPMIRLSGAEIKVISTKEKNGFKITAQELEKEITEKTRVFLLNSPNNPSSAIYSEKRA